MERTRRKNSSPDTIRGISSAGFFFASKRNARSMRQKISCGRRRGNKNALDLQGTSSCHSERSEESQISFASMLLAEISRDVSLRSTRQHHDLIHVRWHL